MEIIQKGDPDKIRQIKEARIKAENPEVSCEKCDCIFQIKKTDVRSLYGLKTVDCPECHENKVLTPTEIPSNYQEDIYQWFDFGNNPNPYQVLWGPGIIGGANIIGG